MRFVLGVSFGLLLMTAADAANEKKPCGLFLESYRELGRVAEFKIALRCTGSQKEPFPVNEPLLVGLTATSNEAREGDLAELEYDFPLQNVVILRGTTETTLTFHAQLSDIAGKSHVYAMAWPLSFLQDCGGGRSGCARFGYALARPASLSKACIKKDKYGDEEISDDFMCRASKDYRFNFR